MTGMGTRIRKGLGLAICHGDSDPCQMVMEETIPSGSQSRTDSFLKGSNPKENMEGYCDFFMVNDRLLNTVFKSFHSKKSNLKKFANLRKHWLLKLSPLGTGISNVVGEISTGDPE